MNQLLDADPWEEPPLRVRPTPRRRLLRIAGWLRELRPGPRWKRGLGLAVQLAGCAGAAVCLVSLVLLPVLAHRVASALPDSLAVLAEAARGLQEPLDLAGESLGGASAALEGVGGMLLSAGESLDSLGTVLGSVSEVLGEDAPEAIDAARDALSSAEAGAQAIDGALRTLSYLGPLTGVTYDPEQSLQEGLSEVAASLEPLPDALRDIGADLDGAVSDLGPLRSSMEEAAGQVGVLAGRIDALEDFVVGRRPALENLALAASGAAEKAPAWVWAVAGAGELLLVVAFLEQIAIVVVGGELRAEAEANGR
jgi:hypothetical protein